MSNYTRCKSLLLYLRHSLIFISQCIQELLGYIRVCGSQSYYNGSARSEEGLRKIEEAVISEFRKFDTVDLEADEYVRGIVRRLDSV